MITPRALVSSITSMIDDDFRADHLKLCFLWYDEVLIETIGKFDDRRYFEQLLEGESNIKKTAHALSDVITPLNKRVSKETVGDVLARMGQGYPRWGQQCENYTYPSPENGEQFAHNQLLAHIANAHGLKKFEDEYEIQQAEGRARVAIDAVSLWERVNSELPCMLQTNGDEKIAMLSAQQYADSSPNPASPLSIFSAEIPSLRNVTWEQIVQFRKNGNLKSLREKFATSFELGAGDLEKSRFIFDQSERDAIESIVVGGRPNFKKVAIEAILANIPGFTFNPFSVFFGFRDTTKAYKKNVEHGWLYLLRDVRAATTESKNKNAFSDK